MWFILYSHLFCHNFNPVKILQKLLIVQYSVLNVPKCVFVWHLCSHSLAEWWVKTVVQRILKSWDSETKTIQYMFPHMRSRHHLQSNNVVLRDPSSVQSRFTFIWHGCFSPYSRCSLTCDFTRVVSGFQDGSSLEKHLRGTTGRGSLEFIIKSPVTRFISCLKVIDSLCEQ